VNSAGSSSSSVRPKCARTTEEFEKEDQHMSDSLFANEKGSVSSGAAESEDQPSQTKEANMPSQFETPTTAPQSKLSTNEVKRYEVTVTAEIQLSLTGCANVYAADADEAVEKVQAQIDAQALDDDLEMQDFDSGYTMPYSAVKEVYDAAFQIDSATVVEDEVDPFYVLEADVKQLEAHILWNTDALAKHKSFLESLLNEGDDKQAVAA
jgi:hypothetical protein